MTGKQDEPHSLRGAIDRRGLIAVRDLFDSNEPLAVATLDNFLNPDVLEVQYDDGLLSAEQSCIQQRPEELVTRAVMKLWRAAYHADSLDPLNAGRNPP